MGRTAIERYIESRDSGGSVALVEHILAPGVLAAVVHWHSREAKYGVVFEGQLWVFQDIVLKLRGHWHTFWNARDGQLRVGGDRTRGLEELFRRLAEPEGEYDAATLPALVADYGPRSTLRQPCHWHSSTTSSSRVAHAAGAASPEELERLLEDACLLNDTLVLPRLFEVDAVLLPRGKGQVRERSAIADVIIDQLRDGGSYVAAPQLVMQSGPLALIISGAATSVARRSLDGWHYVISRLDL